jgi:hypothetical protein
MKLILAIAFCSAVTIARHTQGAENLLQNGSFEAPKVEGSVASAEGGDPTKAEGENSWTALEIKPPKEGGKITVGITDKRARTGEQSFFVDFEALTATRVSALLATKLLPVEGGKIYRTSIWCRIDYDRPLALDERRPTMWTDVDFFKADGKTRAGEPITSAQLIPGSTKPGRIGLIFTSNRWSEITGGFQAPSDAAFADFTWSWTIPNESGETDGVLYCDDVAVTLLPEAELTSVPNKAVDPVASPAPAAAGQP